MNDRWHKRSRFWMVGSLVAGMSHSPALASMIWRPEIAGIAIGSFGATSAALLTAAGAINFSERWKGYARTSEADHLSTPDPAPRP